MQFNVSKFSPVWNQSLALVTLAPATYAAAVLALFASGMAYDALIEQQPDGFFLPTIINTIILILTQIFVTNAMASAAGWREGGAGRYPFMSIFGQSIVIGIGVAVGLLLFILPGLFMAARAFIAPQIVILEGRPAMEALRESWDRTEEHWAAIALLVAIIVAGSIVPLLLPVLFLEMEAGFGSMASFAINGIVAVAQAMSYVIATAAWRTLTHDEDEATRIFG